ncbi:uncharacterized protein [Nicotiana tomentosiformis]|uniref:uncharacterized protein n=1 Tax=Nicotiana tomentosiformis TaxID=4098 RepID=UPI00388CC0C8
MGDYKKEFARLHDYVEILKSTNHGTTAVIRTSKNAEPSKEVFMGIYICLEELKTGWLEGCRNIIGFDGAFLKGICKETEGEGLAIMSDMQKLLPNSEMRWCARHIWANWKQTWPGEERRKKFWQCARATFEVYFSKKVDEMDQLGGDIVQDLLKYNKKTWYRTYFKEHSKYDVVENNMCETFNSWILIARDKSIITMLEKIRIKYMERMNSMREFSRKWVGDISPMDMKMLGDNAQRAAKCEVKFDGETGYEIQDGPYKHIVDFRRCSCTCRSWEDTYLKAYIIFIQPLTSMNLWPKSTLPAIEPPVITAMLGRPKKKRRKPIDEPKKKFGKGTRIGRQMRYFLCKTLGHNKKECPSARNQGGSAGTSSVGDETTENASSTEACGILELVKVHQQQQLDQQQQL